jgi:hypothetical protein
MLKLESTTVPKRGRLALPVVRVILALFDLVSYLASRL